MSIVASGVMEGAAALALNQEGAAAAVLANKGDQGQHHLDVAAARQREQQLRLQDARNALVLSPGAASDISPFPLLPGTLPAGRDELHTNSPSPPNTPALSRSTTIVTTTTTTTRSNSAGSSRSSSGAVNHDRASPHAHSQPPPHQHQSSQQPPTPSSGVRKTSPGLAARLKALGFGPSKQFSSPSPSPSKHGPVGRLDEQHLRQLDQNHQANSITSVISRRGRPWKGAGASASVASTSPSSAARSVAAAESPQLPEIGTSEPLAMDTQKYRLPDHTNGNGTKVTLDTRREHIERSLGAALSLDAMPPPPPPPKDTPPLGTTNGFDSVTSPPLHNPALSSYFTPGHNRPVSVYTLSRASFANQLAQLTSLSLPDADSLSNKVSSIPTAHVAAKALINASEQIRSWITKAQEVIGGLDSDDDVEWAAAGGREGLEEVENAITRFEDLINAYIGAIEELQRRSDVAKVPSDDLKKAVAQMDSIMDEWAHVRATLTSVRVQVELAMEWEELWNTVLGDIQGELDELSRLVFEMEERRHQGAVAAASADNVDIGHLQTMVEESPPPASRLQASHRFSLGLPMSPSSPGTASSLSQDDSSLLALFARMQPLRASLDFLPMRLSTFEARAEKSFPTACEELEMRREALDASYKKLERDAEWLRKELGEDRWVIVFRGAGRQALKMQESVHRSLLKLSEAIEAEGHLQMPPTMLKKMESYEAKKTHYGPAIERVISIIDRGVKERLTVNGEILRLHHDVQSRWESLRAQMREMDAVVDDIQADRKDRQLRDSVSSVLSNDRSTVASGRDTPGSSPPSSVIMTSLGFDPQTPLPRSKGRSPSRAAAGSNGANGPPSAGRRQSSLPAPVYMGRRTGSRLSTIASSATATPGTTAKHPGRPSLPASDRPGWKFATNTSDVDTGHNFKPLSLTTPSPYARATPTTGHRSVSATTPSSASRLPTLRTMFSRATSASPGVEDSPSRGGQSRLALRERLTSPGPYSQQTLTKPRLTTQASMSALSSHRKVSLRDREAEPIPEAYHTPRPATSFASRHRRTTLGKTEETNGRSSPQIPASTRSSARKTILEPKDLKPRWRH